MLKFQRNYYAEFTIIENDKEQEVITVRYPTAMTMNVHVGSYQTANSAQLQFINLERTIQSKLWIDMYNIGKKRIRLRLYAGYNQTMPLIFMGYVQFCFSYRQSGSVNWITEVQTFEGGELFRYGFINTTITEGTRLEDVINYMLESDSSITLGSISPEIKPLQKNRTFIGQTMDILGREYGGYEVFIDKGKLHILGDNDVVKGELLVITDNTGLLGVPRRANLYTEFDLIFEPQLRIGQAISLVSNSQLIKDLGFNQAYKVVNIKHTGTISERTCGKLITTVTATTLTDTPNIVEEAKPTTYESSNVSASWVKPVKGGRISSPFGKRERPTSGASTEHKGIDIAVNLNTPVLAPANGRVALVGNQGLSGYGKYIDIDNGVINGKRVMSRYGHLNLQNVKSGDMVYKGSTQLGLVGSTGASTGPHLHFEVRENNVPVDPTKYIGSFI